MAGHQYHFGNSDFCLPLFHYLVFRHHHFNELDYLPNFYRVEKGKQQDCALPLYNRDLGRIWRAIHHQYINRRNTSCPAGQRGTSTMDNRNKSDTLLDPGPRYRMPRISIIRKFL